MLVSFVADISKQTPPNHLFLNSLNPKRPNLKAGIPEEKVLKLRPALIMALSETLGAMSVAVSLAMPNEFGEPLFSYPFTRLWGFKLF